MKKTVLLFSLISIAMLSNAQKNFTWDKVDSIPKSKSQIYSDTKVFITNTWKSAQDVIQLDDKEAGNIIVKGSSIKEVNHSLNVFTYVYKYSVTFRMKENKYKVTIDNVYCSSAVPIGQAQYDILKIEPFDVEYVKGRITMSVSTLSEKKAVPMMLALKNELQYIFDEYNKYIKKESSFSDDW